VNNTGGAPIDPAFSISPSPSFNVTGYKATLSPGSEESFSISINSASVGSLGINKFQIGVTTGEFTRTATIEIYKLALSPTMKFNGSNPFLFHLFPNGSANLSFSSQLNQSIAIYMVGPNNMSYVASINGTNVGAKGTNLLTASGTMITGGTSESISIRALNGRLPFDVIAFNQTWMGAVAFVEP
jgi:hypothetical protein